MDIRSITRIVGGGLSRLRFWKNWKTWQKALAIGVGAASLGACSWAVPVLIGIAVAIFVHNGGAVTVGENTKIDPPASALANFYASQAKMVFSEQNVQVLSSGGSLTVSIRDEDTGQLLGADTFPYVINNNVATFTNPVQVTNWVHSFSGYDGNVKMKISLHQQLSPPPPGEDGHLTAVAKYAGSPRASGTGYISMPPAGGGLDCPPVCTDPKVTQSAPAPGSS